MEKKKTKQIAKIEAKGKKFSIVYHEGDTNPYWIYRHTWSVAQSGYGITEKKRIEIKYADLHSCFFYLHEIYF